MGNIINSNRAKIVATLGPASNNRETLVKLVMAGVNVFRLNFSHGEHETHKEVIRLIREVNADLNTHVSILQDLQGPKIRVEKVKDDEVFIKDGGQLVITTDSIEGTSERVSTSYQDFAKDIAVGDSVLIDDGNLELRAEKIEGNDVTCKIIYGGSLKSRKGINLPFTNVTAPALTEKDIEDLKFGIDNDVDWIALSFVRTAKDVEDLKRRIAQSGKDIRVVSKIEKPEALKNIDDIIKSSDALMVARGDLGVEIVMEEVPMAQKMIIEKCNEAAKPVIVATQMMESMISNPRPTRAETNDVANAVLDGADAMMLSAETAAGKYPVETVEYMSRTISSVEGAAEIYDHFYSPRKESPTYLNDNVMLAACKLSEQVQARALTGNTVSGYTAFKMSSHRPHAKIYIFTANKNLLTKLSLIWGVDGFFYDKRDSTDDSFEDQERILKQHGHLETGDVFITTASMPIQKSSRTNTLKLNVAK